MADHEAKRALTKMSVLPTLIQQLTSAASLPEALEICLRQMIDSDAKISSGMVAVADLAGQWKVAAAAGSRHAEMMHLPFDSLWKGRSIPDTERFITLTLPLVDRAGLLVIAPANDVAVQPDEQQLWETIANLIALAIGRYQQIAVRDDDTRERLRSEVMATLSHELRTPLSTIKGYATALMLDEVDWEPEERQEFLQLIDEECDNMQMMIGELMDSALIDAGQMRIEPEPVRIPLLVEEIVHEIESHTDQHRFAVNFPARFPILLADPLRIKQVLRNILDNAVKYSPSGGLIVVSGELRPQSTVISITDPGIGISPEHLNSLFEKYFRVRSATGYHVPGTGLGLPLARAIIEAHGGQIWAESRVGHGTTISFMLPLHDLASIPVGEP